MAARRLQISLRVLKNISRGSALFIIIINTNEIPHHFTSIYIFFFEAKVAVTHNPPSPTPTFVLILIECLLKH